ncbi:MAG: radical SAM protein [Porphyromonadaceae bacterium]|nr:radical SAM protein [Porphyromonadaceae bacterium]
MNLNILYFYFRILKSTLHFHRLINAVKIKTSYFLSYFGVLTHWNTKPLFISIEPTNICNLNCPECPVGMRTEQVKQVQVDMRVVQKTLDELSQTLIHVILYFQGEPLINRNFTDIVRYAHSKKILTSSSTNAQLLTDSLAKEIVQSGLDRLIVSVDGATQETYGAYRVGGKLEKALAAIEYLAKWKKKLKSASPLIEVQFIVFKTNEHEMGVMKKLVKKYKADKLTFKTAQLYDFENGNPLLTSIKKYARYELRSDGKYHIKSPLRNRCKRLWEGSVINSRGDVLPCCFDKDSKYAFGNVRNKPFSKEWHSEKAYNFRKGMLENRKQFDMCRNCTEK